MRQAAALLLLALSSAPPRLAAQQMAPSGSRIDVRGNAASPPEAPRPPGPKRTATALPDIEVAYRAFAAGELDAAERMFTELVERQPSPAAHLLRGCTRFTRAMLSRDPGALPEGAREDIRRAFSLNPSLWLDPRSFSPRLIAFVEEVRQQP